MRRARKKQRWFDLGVEAAISRVTGERIPGYVCPLCSRPWSSVEDVSFEHAPPRGLGGRTIALTCRECNSTSGFNLDAELHKAERIRKWDRGQLAEPLRARASIAGLPPLNVDLHRDPDLTTRSLGVPARNDPAITAAHVAWSQAGLESGEPSPAIRCTSPFRGSASDAHASRCSDPHTSSRSLFSGIATR